VDSQWEGKWQAARPPTLTSYTCTHSWLTTPGEDQLQMEVTCISHCVYKVCHSSVLYKACPPPRDDEEQQ